MEIRQLKTFISIVKLGNFSQAAHFLGYTQSTVTTHIQLLEKEFNTALFERFGHQLMLTTDGERLYLYAEQILNLADCTKNELENTGIPHGPIIIGIPESICMYRLSDLVREYALLYPAVELKLKLGTGSDFRALLRKNMMDIAFFLDKKKPEADLISRFLWEEEIVMVASPAHPLVKLKQVTAKDLRDETLLFTDSGSTYQLALKEYLMRVASKPRSIWEIGQIHMVKQFVESNLGVTILPFLAVKPEVEAGELAILPWRETELSTNAYLVHHKEKWISSAIQAFIRLVQERMMK